MWKQTRPPHALFFASDAMMASSCRVVSFDRALKIDPTTLRRRFRSERDIGAAKLEATLCRPSGPPRRR
jgi:hypothetical protein